ncbi:MAG TPA: hypothetical protein VLK84_03940 [Longimicrobium sp.]|nr:hypothetical protein [Longimicrobium sp.]
MHRFPRLMRLAWLPLVAAVLTVAPRPAAAQAVTATSGSPAAIARIRAEYAAIQREAPRLRQTRHEFYEFSLEGGELVGFYRGRELRKLSAHQFGETWQGTEEYYFSGGRLIFIHTVTERYDEPMSGRVQVRTEHRFYFDNGRLIRRVRTRNPAALPDGVSPDDEDVAHLLKTARIFAACAAAPAGAERECTAPAR